MGTKLEHLVLPDQLELQDTKMKRDIMVLLAPHGSAGVMGEQGGVGSPGPAGMTGGLGPSGQNAELGCE